MKFSTDSIIAPDILYDYSPDEPRIPVLMAVKGADQKRIKSSMANSESKKQEVKFNHQKLPKLPYSVETLEAILSRGLKRDQSYQGSKQQKEGPIYQDSLVHETVTQRTTQSSLVDPMAHGGAEPVPSIALPSRNNLVQRPSGDIRIPVIVGYPKRDENSMQTSESIRRPVYRMPAASTDVYTIENLLYGDRRPMHSNSIFYQKALSYLKQYRRAMLQHHSYQERMVDEETPKEIVRAYDPMSPLIHQQQGPTVPGGYQTSRRDSDYGRADERRRQPVREDEQSREQDRDSEQVRDTEQSGKTDRSQDIEREESSQGIPRDAIAIQDNYHNVVGFLPVISLGGSGSSSPYSGSSSNAGSNYAQSGSGYGQSQSTAQKQSSLRKKPLSPSLKLQNLLRSSKRGPRGENTIPFLTVGLRQRY